MPDIGPDNFETVLLALGDELESRAAAAHLVVIGAER
jgi:hypothetical protein